MDMTLYFYMQPRLLQLLLLLLQQQPFFPSHAVAHKSAQGFLSPAGVRISP